MSRHPWLWVLQNFTCVQVNLLHIWCCDCKGLPDKLYPSLLGHLRTDQRQIWCIRHMQELPRHKPLRLRWEEELLNPSLHLATVSGWGHSHCQLRPCTHRKEVAAVKDVPQDVADNVGPERPWQLLQQLSLMYLCTELLTLTPAATISIQLLLC